MACTCSGRLAKCSERPECFANDSQSNSTVIPALSEDVMPLQSTSIAREPLAPNAVSPVWRALVAVAKMSGPRAVKLAW